MGSALDGGTGNGKGGKVVRLGQAGTGTGTDTGTSLASEILGLCQSSSEICFVCLFVLFWIAIGLE